MLANAANIPIQSGHLDKDVHLPETSRYEMIDFIVDELPRWRDFSGRPPVTSETDLTDQLCDHLNSAARHSIGWDFLQFRTEVGDEQNKGRKIDLVPKPCAATVWINGRRHTQFDTLMPIECKRLPTPAGTDRDEREYVFSGKSSTGGIQRFKAGHHGAVHKLGAMIGYVQEGNFNEWKNKVAGWINALIKLNITGWTSADLPRPLREDEVHRISVLKSVHTRGETLSDIELRHLWIQMN
jgi:hypothetical protein